MERPTPRARGGRRRALRRSGHCVDRRFALRSRRFTLRTRYEASSLASTDSVNASMASSKKRIVLRRAICKTRNAGSALITGEKGLSGSVSDTTGNDPTRHDLGTRWAPSVVELPSFERGVA